MDQLALNYLVFLEKRRLAADTDATYTFSLQMTKLPGYPSFWMDVEEQDIEGWDYVPLFTQERPNCPAIVNGGSY